MKMSSKVLVMIAAALMMVPSFSRAASKIEVEIEDFAFVPSTVTVMTGDTVEWVNRDAAGHTSTSGENGTPDGIWDSGLLSKDESFSYVFTEEGSFPYYCAPHTWMTGMVNVEPVSDTTDTIPEDTIPTSIIEDSQLLPPSLDINPSIIRFYIPASNSVRLEVFDLLGTQTDVLARGSYPAGSHEISRPRLQPGIYFVRFTWGNVTMMRKMIAMK